MTVDSHINSMCKKGTDTEVADLTDRKVNLPFQLRPNNSCAMWCHQTVQSYCRLFLGITVKRWFLFFVNRQMEGLYSACGTSLFLCKISRYRMYFVKAKLDRSVHLPPYNNALQLSYCDGSHGYLSFYLIVGSKVLRRCKDTFYPRT